MRAVDSVGRRRVCPLGESRHDIQLPEELFDQFTRVVALRETIELAHDPMEGTLGFLNRAFRVVLTLPLQTLVVFDEFLSEELSDADAKRSAQRLDYAWRLDTRNPTFRGHFNRGYLPV